MTIAAAASGPQWTDVVTAISSAVAALGFIAAAIAAWFAYDAVKETRRDRHIQLLMDYGSRWDDERLFEAREKRSKIEGAALLKAVAEWIENPEKQSDVPVLLRIPNYFEDLAIMVWYGKLDLDFVEKGFSALAFWEWDYWKDAILVMRVQLGDDQTYVEFEKLVDELRARESGRRAAP